MTQIISSNQGILGCNGFRPPIIMATVFFNVQWLLHHVETHHPWECFFLRLCSLWFVRLPKFANTPAKVNYIGKLTLSEVEVSQMAHFLAWTPWLVTHLLATVKPLSTFALASPCKRIYIDSSFLEARYMLTKKNSLPLVEKTRCLDEYAITNFLVLENHELLTDSASSISKHCIKKQVCKTSFLKQWFTTQPKHVY